MPLRDSAVVYSRFLFRCHQLGTLNNCPVPVGNHVGGSPKMCYNLHVSALFGGIALRHSGEPARP